MTSPAAKTKPRKRPRTSDLRGAAQLATHATVGVTHIAEGVHQSVWSTLGFPGGNAPGRAGGITGLVYRSVRGVAYLVGKGVDATLATLHPLLDAAETHLPGTQQREAILAALNGVIGHHLAATHNPLAIRMSVRYRGEPLDWQALPPMPDATGKVLLLIHGLCMSDQHWHAEHEGRVVDHGEALASALGYTALYLRYNTGLHVSQNGRELAAMLEALVAHWPVPIEDLTVVVHSMGGLVIRSACECAKQDALRWPARLKNLVFLGTPHHGAPLERAGNRVDVLLGSTQWTAPFARLGHLRSAGITDLRYGHIVDEDWQGHHRFHRKPDTRQLVPLPEGVACFTVAATLAARRSHVADRLLGDGLVPLASALGQHDDPQRTLAFPKSSRWIAYRTSHLGLLSSPAVSRQIVHWLAAQPIPGTAPVPG